MGRLYGACCPGERLELIPMIKMETRHPVEIQFDCEYVAICYHCRVMAAWSSQNWKIFEKCLRFCGKTTTYDKILKILFGKFTSRYQSTLFCAKFVKIVQREIGESVRYLPDQQKTIFFRLPLELWLLHGSRRKSAMASPQPLADNFPNFVQIGLLVA